MIVKMLKNWKTTDKNEEKTLILNSSFHILHSIFECFNINLNLGYFTWTQLEWYRNEKCSKVVF